jgi:site-specific DNA-methyltransferase (adenine-specific)
MASDIKLFNMDCMEALREMEDNQFDLAIVDPPYGGNDAIGMSDCKRKSAQATNRTNYKLFENIQPTQEYFDELKRVSKKQIIWGVNFYTALGLDGGRICWDKKGTAFGRAELAYFSHSKSVEVFEFAWNGMIQGDMKNKEKRQHPTQKPVALYKWLLTNYAEKGQTILDTHLGSGSIAIACWDLGFDLCGYELDVDYYKAALNRLEGHKRQGQFEFA